MKKSNTVKFARITDYPNAAANEYTPVETKISQNRKEDHFFESLLAVAKTETKPNQYNPGGMSAVIDCCFYGAGKYPKRIYCCVWLKFPANKRFPNGICISGGGYAGGWGYDRKSAALADALSAAGVELPWSLSGTGENERALKDICAAAGIKKFSFIGAHG
jgi:hypothetical protein